MNIFFVFFPPHLNICTFFSRIARDVEEEDVTLVDEELRLPRKKYPVKFNKFGNYLQLEK